MHEYQFFYKNSSFRIVQKKENGENMKTFTTMALIGLICTSQAFAGYEVIGETTECPIKTKVIQRVSGDESSLLVIHERDVYELILKRQLGSMKIYTSPYQMDDQERFMTFSAIIMGPEMSRLSELKIYLSGIMINCLIDK